MLLLDLRRAVPHRSRRTESQILTGALGALPLSPRTTSGLADRAQPQAYRMDPARLASILAVACILVACEKESAVATTITVTSPAFSNGAAIPPRYTCSGADVSPPISWSGVPNGVQSLALTVIDPDAPGKPFVHWVVFGLAASSSGLTEGEARQEGILQGRNDFGSNGYRGPCPPAGAPHHYHFKVYALDTNLSLRSGVTEAAFEDAIKGHVMATGELVGTFKR